MPDLPKSLAQVQKELDQAQAELAKLKKDKEADQATIESLNQKITGLEEKKDKILEDDDWLDIY